MCDAGGHHRWSAHAGGVDRARSRDCSTVRAAVERKQHRPATCARVDPATCCALVIAMVREMTRTQQKDAWRNRFEVFEVAKDTGLRREDPQPTVAEQPSR